MAARVLLVLLLAICLASSSSAIYEDQVGLADWHQKYIGKVKQAVFHTQKAGRRRVVVSTEENVIASLDLRTGDIFWRHVLGKNDPVDQIGLSLGKYVVTLSSEGSVLRAWNLPDGQMVWESNLQFSTPTRTLLHIISNSEMGKDNLILVSGGGWIYAVSSIDGVIVWRKEFGIESLEIKQVIQTLDSDTIYAIGFVGSSQVTTYQISSKSGDVIKHNTASILEGFCCESAVVSSDVLVALDVTKSILLLINYKDENINYHRAPISDIIQDFDGVSNLLPLKSNGIFALRTKLNVVLLKVKGEGKLEVIEISDRLAAVSDALPVSEEEHAFAIVQPAETKIQLRVKLNSDLTNDVLKETIKTEQNRVYVEKVFLNNYVRTDKSHGFRALLVMEDHSLVLVQQGEVVWSREDGLASIIDATTCELPVEKEGVSVAKVEHSLFEWLKGHILKLKGTLMLASPDELAAIQAIRLRSSEKNKMTRDHNGFRKLIIVLTKAGKILALHTGNGRVIWSRLLPSLQQSKACDRPSALSIYQWQVPHHQAMHENPSVLVVGNCRADSDATGILLVVDSYSGKELNSLKLSYPIDQVIPLPFTDSSEQRLHLILDAKLHAHLYPRSSDSINVFLREMENIYIYTVDSGKNVVKGYSLPSRCNPEVFDEYCFSTREVWSIVFPSETEKIDTTATRKMNEVVHTQAKVLADQDVMYEYISRNILFVATVSPKAAGGIGSIRPEEACLVAYLIDTVTGRILHRVSHQGAQGPVHAVLSENWVVYHYFNLRAHRYEMSVIEIYDKSRADNKDVWKLVSGKHNLSTPITLYARPEVSVKSQSYFFTHSVKEVAVTATAKGITSKQILIGTIGDQVLALDKRYLDPRRSANPTQAEKEEGIIPLTDSLPIIPQSYVTHSLQVEGLRRILAFPAKLESTTHVFSYGVDLFYTRIAPSRTYDSLTDEFSYALLLITIVALVAAIVATWILSEKKELREKWR